MRTLPIPVLSCALATLSVAGQDARYGRDRFRQMDREWPTANEYRAASGAPGHSYWQQKVDYDMQLEIDDATQKLTGSETITYHNNSPDKLDYLWLQLDQNLWLPGSDAEITATGSVGDSISLSDLKKYADVYEGGFRITAVNDASGKAIPYTINKTMMRVDVPKAIPPGGTLVFHVNWWYPINDRLKVGGRSGWEYFPDDKNYIYAMAQFFPRLCVYNDYAGWQNKQFLGRGEFTLEYGDYKVSITVPADHIVGATGELQNASSVLSADQRSRLEKARTAGSPVLIVTDEEAKENEKEGTNAKKTWIFKATTVRDFAFASSRKFIWDGMDQPVGDHHVLCMSFYPKEGNPLWGQYSTKVVAHTIKTYSKYSVNYPYPVAQSVHTKDIGMEYPMICFNGGRPEKDGTYSQDTKNGMIGVVTHEVGHNFFPMIISSDERQWTWQDEGFNTFVQTLTEQEWDRDQPMRRGAARTIVDYMKGDRTTLEPMMTSSDCIEQFGQTQYSKTAAGLTILRETVMGRELFDKAFQTYCKRWLFKHPTPWDFFRSMEDASAVDLDWFWRGWFYTTDPVDIAINNVICSRADAQNTPEKVLPPTTISYERNLQSVPQTVVERDPATRDFYYERSKATPAPTDPMANWTPEERATIANAPYLYEVTFENKGGMPMAVIVQWTFTDGTTEIDRMPAELWRYKDKVTRVFAKKKEVKSMLLDPNLETADIDTGNNVWNGSLAPVEIKVYKEKPSERTNPMQRAKQAHTGQ